ncbi:MAG: hypothetical protein HY730_00815 [Candidatus Tectomicrobia bacterium]|uniref:Uncharacterized protein n=1 Tax=Tectimicrobiota bacterium TaxID=2528274 RepID=A0A933LQ30_UNCTE|nr:hypothetical protein [Candidatus Tectomicrobia bacterium]
MRLILAYPRNRDFVNPEELVKIISGYFPKLIVSHCLIESQSLAGCFAVEETEQIAETIAKPKWEIDIVFLAMVGPIFAYQDLLLDNYAGTFQSFQLDKPRSFPKFPKIGGYYNMDAIRRHDLHKDIKFFGKLAAEEILHVFDVPKNHDMACFFHGQPAQNKRRNHNEYCGKCLTLMKTVESPLDLNSIFQLVDTIYAT